MFSNNYEILKNFQTEISCRVQQAERIPEIIIGDEDKENMKKNKYYNLLIQNTNNSRYRKSQKAF